ncbi:MULTISPECIES: FusB/FusC family EF-G-binding protein [Staphylococcus]|uniref:FusB/FusC family EF-G-binding protein n=1 Tax=Staphylococcus TaxID=1279 RepID=UPI000CD0DAED|nr:MULTISPECIES: FusB/FusC family EF-G-binding protein [Staphylococcus]NHM76123.1 FusB/FusC family EF-G-binding protein [Staphylococcus sp. 11007852]NJH82842.1 hypothetical protein [Staphylococcus agnetis]NJH86050.1 hypothetical protein [Staphylococcus agnetis]NJI15726.1 hypothetical protein [Staphylococcus agnetis]PNY84304.1 hypothetical protein CD172_10875 [Staphylococcus agnetis]
MNQIKAYEFIKVKQRVNQLIRLYKTNDIQTHAMQKQIIFNEIKEIFEAQHIYIDDFINQIDDVTLTKKKASMLLENLKVHVEAFELPTSNALHKCFRKVKKLKLPETDHIDLKETTFLGWNDLASHRKYIVYREGNQLKGMYGDLSPTKVKGFCKICNAESYVSLFLNQSKHNKKEGTYTKKGDYICYDSVACNGQLEDITRLYHFIEQTK